MSSLRMYLGRWIWPGCRAVRGRPLALCNCHCSPQGDWSLDGEGVLLPYCDGLHARYLQQVGPLLKHVDEASSSGATAACAEASLLP